MTLRPRVVPSVRSQDNGAIFASLWNSDAVADGGGSEGESDFEKFAYEIANAEFVRPLFVLRRGTLEGCSLCLTPHLMQGGVLGSVEQTAVKSSPGKVSIL